MKKFVLVSLAIVGGYALFLKASQTMQLQATWNSVADPVE
ncbi:DLW-39 family protein [Arcanobacterium pinnipediorum]|uniref:DLW-39 family protein n=1 Tax=Arcanobacterium pinnipediorum TaxID=1503041 RepID=A0ABY5AJ11_9ACTO|nr:DLW-39 family protein [Arcanobacterium pinnipediorum]USR79426.1 DLW-39 family protein [Arcanobacterium pinnipediorum]